MAETNPEDKLTKKSNTLAQQLKRLKADLKELEGLLDSGFGRIKEITGPKRRSGTKRKEIQALVNVFKADEEKYNAAKASIKKVEELSTGLSIKNINNDVVDKIFDELDIIKKNSNFIITRAKIHKELENKPGYIFKEEAHGYEGTMAFPDLSDFKKGLGNPKFAGDPSKKKSEKSIIQRAVENRQRLFGDTNISTRGSIENALKPKPRKNKEGVARTTAVKKKQKENVDYLEKLKSGNLQESEYNKAANAIIRQAGGFINIRKKSENFDPAVDTSKYSDDIEKQTGYTLDQILALEKSDRENVGNIIIEGIKRKKEERFSSKISPSNITESEAKNISEAVTNTSQSIEKESNASGPKLSERINPKTGLPYPVLTREMKEAMGIGKNTVLAEQVIGKSLAQQQEEASKNIKEEVITNELGAKITRIISPESSPITDIKPKNVEIKPIESINKTESGNGGGGAKIVSLGGGGGGGTGGGTGGAGSSGGGTGGGGTGGGGKSGGGRGAGGGGGGNKKAPGGGSIIDVRLVEISPKSIKQLEDLLIKVLKKSNITASKTLPALKSTGAKIVPIGGTTPATSSGGKIVPFNNTTTTPSGLTVIPGGTTPTTSSGGKIVPFNNTTTTPSGLTVIPGGLNQSATPGGTSTTGGTTKLPKDVLDPFRKRLLKIFKEGEEELTLLYAKTDSFVGWIPGFNSAILDARKKGLETLSEGYKAFDKAYVDDNGVKGSAFRGMMASIKTMIKISPMTVIMAGLTSAFIGILGAATRLNSKIKEISAELGTSNMQSYEFFKNAMNAQTQYDNMYASLRDVRDVQKGILGDSGILLQVNDKALSSIADNAKNIGVSTEAAGAFTEALRTKGATDVEAANLMAASLELADKSKFIMPQSVMDDIAQNVEFSSKYFSNINKDSKSAQKHLVDTNLQVKALGLNFQKAAKMTQHLLSFEQSIVGEVEASVALGRHVNIGKARELLLQDDIGGAMQQMMDTMGGYDEFQNMDFAKRQLMANAVGLEVSELEKSLYLRDKIGITNEEALNAAMKNSDYLDKVAGKNVELYKVEAKKVLAAEQFNTAVEKVSMAFKSSLLPVLEAILPIVELMASAINFVAGGIKTVVGGITGANKNKEAGAESPSSPSMYQMGSYAVMATVMGGQLLKMIKGPVGGKIGEVVGKARGGLDTLTGTLGTKSNPMYVISLGGGGGGGVGSSGGLLDNLTDGIDTGTSKNKKGRLTKKGLPDRRFKANRLPSTSTIKPSILKGFTNNLKNFKPGNLMKSIVKTGGFAAAIFAGFDYIDRKSQGQSTAQALSGSAAGALGSLGGAAFGAAIGSMLLPGVGTVVGGLLGAYFGSTASTSIADSHFDKNKSSSFTGGYGIYAGMGLSTAGSIIANNKPKAIGTPVETSMVDTTPTTLKPNFSSPFSTTPNFGTTSMSRESVMVNRSSKSVATMATMQKTVEEKEKKEEALLKATDYTNKLLEAIVSKQNIPVIAYFNDEGRRQVKSTLRKESSP